MPMPESPSPDPVNVQDSNSSSPPWDLGAQPDLERIRRRASAVLDRVRNAFETRSNDDDNQDDPAAILTEHVARQSRLLQDLARHVWPYTLNSSSQGRTDLDSVLASAFKGWHGLLHHFLSSAEERSQADAWDDCVALLWQAQTVLDQVQTLMTAEGELSNAVSNAPLGVAPLVRAVLIHCERAPEAYAAAWPTVENALRQLFATAKRLWAVWLRVLTGWTWPEDDDNLGPGHHGIRLLAQVAQCAELMLPLDFVAFGKTVSVLMELTQRLPESLREPQNVRDLWPKLADQARQLVPSIAAFLTHPAPKCPEVTMVIFAFKVIDKFVHLFGGQLGTRFEPVIRLIAECLQLRVTGDQSLPNVEQQKLVVDLPGWIQSALKSLMSDPKFAQCLMAGPILSKTSTMGEHDPAFAYLLVGAEVLLLMAQIEENARLMWFSDENTNLLNSVLTWSNLCGESFERLHDFTGLNSVGSCSTVDPSANSVYIYVLLRVQSFITTMSEREFRVVEGVLMRVIVEPNVVLSNLELYWKARLTLDIWSFLVRFAPPQICQSHVCLLLEIALDSPFEAHPLVPMAVRRLGAFLHKKVIIEFENEFALAKDTRHIRALRCIPRLSPEVRTSLLNDCLHILDQPQSYCASLSQFELLILALEAITACDNISYVQVEGRLQKVMEQVYAASWLGPKSSVHIQRFVIALYQILAQHWCTNEFQANDQGPPPCFNQIKTVVDQNSFNFTKFANLSVHFKSDTFKVCPPVEESIVTPSSQNGADISSLIQVFKEFVQSVQSALGQDGFLNEELHTRILIENTLHSVETCTQRLEHRYARQMR